jgi:transcription antitermination factor NusG
MDIKPMPIINRKWYAIYVKPNHEKTTAANLKEKGIDAYCPINRTYRKWSDRVKLVELPLLSCYVFVKILLKKEKVKVLEEKSVRDFIKYLKEPAVIREQEMQQLKLFALNYTDIKVEAIRIRGFEDQQVKLKEVLEDNKVILELPSLGFSLTATLSKDGKATVFLR